MTDITNTEDNFNIKEYQEYLLSDEYKEAQLKKITDNYRLMKSIELENRHILSAFSDPEKKQKMIETVNQVWGVVLDTNTEQHTIEDIVKMTLEGDNVKFLNDNKHMKFFPSLVMYETHQDHKAQKKLVRGKYLSKRQTKKQKTPLQTISYVYDAKSASDRDDKLNRIEQSLQDAHTMISKLAVNQLQMQQHIDMNSSNISNIQESLEDVQKLYTDSRKVQLYTLHKSNPSLSYEELGDMIGVVKRTVIRWMKDFKRNNLI